MTSGNLVIAGFLALILAKMPTPDKFAEFPALVGVMMLAAGAVVMIAEAWRKGR